MFEGMGFWSFLRKRPQRPDEPTAGTPAEPPSPTRDEKLEKLEKLEKTATTTDEAADIQALLRAAQSERDVDAALRILARLRSSPSQGAALEELVRRHRVSPLADAVTVAVARDLVDRGEVPRAQALLGDVTSPSGLLLRADLASLAGDLPRALALAERVLFRDVDHPGARERQRRWREALGLAEPEARAGAGTTVVAHEPDAPFLLLREVARGGAGAVYEAEDRELGRRVALKVYHHAARDRAQLAHEAEVAARLAGPGVVRVFDADPAHGWIALEWAPLGAIREHVRAKATAVLSPVEAWAVPLAQAIARVHASGWVHHDIKPANVLLVAPGEPLLTDFGIARRVGEPAPPGSAGYVSPERLAGRASDPRDDVYGFGRLLEDVLATLPREAVPARLRALASACVGDDERRPGDGSALVTRLGVD